MFLFKNNATSRLQIATPAGSATITVAPGDGAKFPQPVAPDIFSLTVEDRRTGQLEIMSCTGRSGDILNVTRAQEGTTAQDFLVGATASNRLTAATMTAVQSITDSYTRAQADAKFVDVAGDTMTAPLVLPAAAPTLPQQAANKSYVDAQVATSAPLVHTHPESQVINLVADLAARPVDAASDSKIYGRLNAAWVETITKATYTTDQGTVTTNLGLKEDKANKGQPNGYAPLDGTSKVPAINLPPAAPFPEAPTDGAVYGRQGSSATWQSVTAMFAGYVTQTGTTGAANVPAGTTAARPSNLAGRLRFNSDLGAFEGNNGVGWSGLGGGVVTSQTPPPAPKPGDLWYKSDVCQLYVYYDDGNTQQWVVTTPNQDITGLDARYVAKTGDRMTGPLQIGGASVSPAPAAYTAIAGTLVAGTNLGINLYPDAGNNWDRMIAGYAGIFQCNPADGSFNWYSGSTGAAGATAALTTALTMSKEGNLRAYGNVQARAAPVTAAMCPNSLFADYFTCMNLGFNGYVNPAQSAWQRIQAGYGGVLRYNTSTGQWSLNNGGNGAADAAFTEATVMTVSFGGVVNFYNNVYSSTGFICQPSGQYNAFMAMNGAGNAYLTLGLDSGGGGLINHSSPSPVMTFQLGGSSKMVLNTAGLQVSAPTSANYTIDGRAMASYGGIIGFAPSTSFYGISGYNGNYSFYGNGTAYISNGTWTTSDARFKDIDLSKGATTEAILIVEAIPVRSFTWKGPMADAPNGDEQFGFIAQEVEPVLPIAVMDIVAPRHDERLRGFLNAGAKADEDVTFKGLNNEYLVAVLWQAVQELSARVKELEAR